jgi:hypothetical protein
MAEIFIGIAALLNAVGICMLAAAAWITYAFYHRKALEDVWVSTYRILYAEFWKEEKIAKVRGWIGNNNEYRGIEKILIKRLSSDDNCLSLEENHVIEYIDYFCALISRAQHLNALKIDDGRRKMWNETFGSFWTKKIEERENLRKYVEKYWPHLELGKF